MLFLKKLSYRLPIPKTILLTSKGASLPSEGNHLSGMKLSGSGYSIGSLSIALHIKESIWILGIISNAIVRTSSSGELWHQQGFDNRHIHRLHLQRGGILKVLFDHFNYTKSTKEKDSPKGAMSSHLHCFKIIAVIKVQT